MPSWMYYIYIYIILFTNCLLIACIILGSVLGFLKENHYKYKTYYYIYISFPVAQMVEHGASNAKIMGSIPRESKSWSNVKL